MRNSINMQGIRFAAAVMILVLGLGQTCFSQDEKPDPLASNMAYQKTDTLGKLKIIAEMVREKTLERKDIQEQTDQLALAFMQEKSGNDPRARLKTFIEIKEMAARNQPLHSLTISDKLRAPDFTRLLFELYKTTDSNQARLEVLISLKNQDLWHSQLGSHEIQIACINHIAQTIKDLPPEKGWFKALEMLADYKEKNIFDWSNLYSAMETFYLNMYLESHTEYQKMELIEKIRLLEQLEKRKYIMSFGRSHFETPLVARMLAEDENFIAADNEGKKEIIKALASDPRKREIHTFTTSKLETIFGLK